MTAGAFVHFRTIAFCSVRVWQSNHVKGEGFNADY
jgi:hypothetical protein